MPLKPALSFQDQLNLLKRKKLVIKDDRLALGYLAENNYYHLNKYFHEFLDASGDFIIGTDFDEIITINENDKFLRNLIFRLIDPIEIKLKTVIANYLSLKYGSRCFYDNSFSRDKKLWANNFIKMMQDVFRDPTHPVVAWHIENYEAEFPLWVLMEFVTFGSVSSYFANLNVGDKNAIGSIHYQGVPGDKLESWFRSLGLIRNRCAHGGHLFRQKLTSLPKPPNFIPTTLLGSYPLFLIFCVIRELSKESDWASARTDLATRESVTPFLIDYGFPSAWEKYI